MYLLRPFTGTGAIFFPIGLPPDGTCEFSTESCRENCYVGNNSLFDFESHIPKEEARDIYDYIVREPSIDKICKKIKLELMGLRTPILHWFGTGDCPTKDIDKISAIIDTIPKTIVQMGFTRNIELWEKYKDIFSLTVERRDDIRGREGMFSIPDYVEGISIMSSSNYSVRGGYCGPITCRDIIESKLEHQINCQVCHKLLIGCFDRRGKK